MFRYIRQFNTDKNKLDDFIDMLVDEINAQSQYIIFRVYVIEDAGIADTGERADVYMVQSEGRNTGFRFKNRYYTDVPSLVAYLLRTLINSTEADS